MSKKPTKAKANKNDDFETGAPAGKGDLINFGGDADLGDEFEKAREPNIVRK